MNLFGRLAKPLCQDQLASREVFPFGREGRIVRFQPSGWGGNAHDYPRRPKEAEDGR